MKKISVLKLGNMNRENLKKREMDFLVGGNYCSNGIENQKANYYSGKCSCVCIGDDENHSSYLSDEASIMKFSGIIVP